MTESNRPVMRGVADNPTSGLHGGTDFRVVSTDGMHWQPYVGQVALSLLPAVMATHYPADGDDRLFVTLVVDRALYEWIYGAVVKVSEAGVEFIDGTVIGLDEIVSFAI